MPPAAEVHSETTTVVMVMQVTTAEAKAVGAMERGEVVAAIVFESILDRAAGGVVVVAAATPVVVTQGLEEDEEEEEEEEEEGTSRATGAVSVRLDSAGVTSTSVPMATVVGVAAEATLMSLSYLSTCWNCQQRCY